MRFRSLLVEARAFVDYGDSSDAVILSEATAKNFRPASLAGRAAAESKDLLLFPGHPGDPQMARADSNPSPEGDTNLAQGVSPG